MAMCSVCKAHFEHSAHRPLRKTKERPRLALEGHWMAQKRPPAAAVVSIYVTYTSSSFSRAQAGPRDLALLATAEGRLRLAPGKPPLHRRPDLAASQETTFQESR